MNIASLIAQLQDPSAYAHRVDAVELIQTHISYVLLAGDYAYKIKKPVDFGFVDYTTLERRHQMCEQEVRLNRRLCDGVYLGVVPVTRDRSGRVRVGGKGDVVEYAVQMTRVPDERMMPALLASGQFEDRQLHALAAMLARFHQEAATNTEISSFGTPKAIWRNWEENFEQTERFVGRTLSGDEQVEIRHFVTQFLNRNAEVFVERSMRDCIRDCHGDLRADSVVIWPDDSIGIMDCIEFNDRIRFGDVASDVAFLAMDLEFRGHMRLADEFVSAYMERRDDETLTTVLNFYRVYRAFVRGKVESMLLDNSQVTLADRQRAGERAGRYFRIATQFAQTRPPSLITMVGLSGSGKSWVGSALAGRLSAALVRSDYVRREYTASVAPGEFGAGAYSTPERERVYEEMFERAARYLKAGQSVVLDATFPSRALRSRARKLALDNGVRFVAIEVIADERTVRARLNARSLAPGASDARWDTYLAQRDQFERLDELPASERLTLDSSQPLDRLIATANMCLMEGS